MPFIEISWRNQAVSIEYQWVGSNDTSKPILVFLHEGLGSLAMWKDYPTDLCHKMGFRGLVYSRPAYGNSTPKPKDVFWKNDFLHQQALEVFPALLSALAIQEPVCLLGHSDGGSIALLIAAHLSKLVKSVAVVAPHIFVEDITINCIEQAKVQYLKGTLKIVLSKYHQDVDSAFWGWNDVWLNPEFRKFGDNMCTRANANKTIWGIDPAIVAALIVLQLAYNLLENISSGKDTHTSIDVDNTNKARIPYELALREMGQGEMKLNKKMNDGERTACGVVNDSTARVQSPVCTVSPVVKVTQLGELNKKFTFINPGPDPGSWPEGQDSVTVKIGKHKVGDPAPKEVDCTLTNLYSKLANVIIFSADDAGMQFVGYARYVNTRKESGSAATKFSGIIS